MQLSDVLTVIGIGVPLAVGWAVWTLRTAFRVQALKAEVLKWKTAYESEKTRSDALTRRDDEERVATLNANKLVDVLVSVGVIPRSPRPEVVS
jgi:hypothetical protein